MSASSAKVSCQGRNGGGEIASLAAKQFVQGWVSSALGYKGVVGFAAPASLPARRGCRVQGLRI